MTNAMAMPVAIAVRMPMAIAMAAPVASAMASGMAERWTFTFTNEYRAVEDIKDQGLVREQKRAARRAAMPVVSAIVAEYAQFKPTVIYASENGIVVGKPPVYAEIFTVPAGYAPMAQIDTKGKR